MSTLNQSLVGSLWKNELKERRKIGGTKRTEIDIIGGILAK